MLIKPGVVIKNRNPKCQKCLESNKVAYMDVELVGSI